MNSKMLVSTTLLCLLALAMGASNEADTCTTDSSGHNQCQDKSSLLQAKVIVNEPLAVEAPAVDELEAPTSDGSDPDKGGSGDGTDSVHNPTHEKVYTENEHTRETDKECKDFNEMSACGAAGCAWEQGACVEEASNQTANSLLAKVDGHATNQVVSEKGCRRRRAHRRRRSRSLAATGECAKACVKLGSCHKRWRQYRPLNMAGQGRTKEASVNACQQRCGRTKGCAYFSFWRDGGCHIQDSKAQARAGCCGVKSGPASCESSTQKTGAGSAPAAAPAAGPPKCWRKMPTGCGKTLSEAGSQGTGLNWFIDTGSTNSAKCTARAADFNIHCGKSDAMTKWGSKPTAGSAPAAPASAPTTAPKAASSAGPLFNRIDKNGDNSITEGEFNKASAAGTITVKA